MRDELKVLVNAAVPIRIFDKMRFDMFPKRIECLHRRVHFVAHRARLISFVCQAFLFEQIDVHALNVRCSCRRNRRMTCGCVMDGS